jgi:hypothetical protein
MGTIIFNLQTIGCVQRVITSMCSAITDLHLFNYLLIIAIKPYTKINVILVNDQLDAHFLNVFISCLYMPVRRKQVSS